MISLKEERRKRGKERGRERTKDGRKEKGKEGEVGCFEKKERP